MVTEKTRASSKASFNDGLYLFFSRKTIVSLRTFTRRASSSCVMSNRARNSLILLFIPDPPEVKKEPAQGKHQRHAQDSGTQQFFGIERDPVFDEYHGYP